MQELSTIEAKLIEFTALAYHKDQTAVNGDTVLADLSTRSVLLVGLVSLIEDEYKVTLTLPEAGASKTVHGLAELVASKLNK